MTTSSGKGPETKAPTFEYVSQERILSLYQQHKGTQYFIPEGFEPVLIPSDSPLQPVANLLQNGKGLQQQLLLQKQFQHQLLAQKNQNVTAGPGVLLVTPTTSSDVRFPSLVLAARATTPTPRGGAVAKAAKPKKPPRPPNAFILYRRSKQPEIVAANEGISNNEVSKQVGEMWHKEPADEKSKFQRMADTAKMEHMKKYPEYKYRPRRPHEKRRRTKRPSISNGTSATAASTTDTTVGNPTIIGGHQQQQQQQEHQQHIDRRASIDTVCTVDPEMFNYYDLNSRRCSTISLDNDDYSYDQMVGQFDDSMPFMDEPIEFEMPGVLSSDSHDDYGVCVETTNPFSLSMEDIIVPSSDSSFEFFGSEYIYNNEVLDFLTQNGQMIGATNSNPEQQNF